MKQKGFTLVETLIAIAILAIVVFGVTGALTIGVKVIGQGKARVGAVSLANKRMEMLRNLAYNDIGTVDGEPAGLIPQEESITLNGVVYTIATEIGYIDDPTDGEDLADEDGNADDYKRVRVEVSWLSRDGAAPVVTVSDFMPEGTEATEGTEGTLIIYVLDDQDQPVALANVHILNNDVFPSVDDNFTTNPQGWVTFSGLPSIEKYEITVTKSGYSSAYTYDAAGDNPNPDPGHLTILAGKTTEKTFYIDLNSSLAINTLQPKNESFWSDYFVDDSGVAESSNMDVGNGEAGLSRIGSVEFTDGITDSDLCVFPGVDGDCGQSFTMGSENRTTSEVRLYLRKATANPSDIYLEIRSQSMTGSVMRSSYVIDSASLPDTFDWVTFTLQSSVTLSANTQYFLRLRSDGTQGLIHWGYNSSSIYDGGSAWRYIEGGVAMGPTDEKFGGSGLAQVFNAVKEWVDDIFGSIANRLAYGIKKLIEIFQAMASPGENIEQIHYRWRNDNGGEGEAEFGSGGYLVSDRTGGVDTAYAIDSDAGYLYTAGSCSGCGTNGGDAWVIEKRSKATGVLDANFASGGVVISDPSSGQDRPNSIIVDDSAIYIVGYQVTTDANATVGWRIEKRDKTTGDLVGAFDNDGVVISNPYTGADRDDKALSVINDETYLYIVGHEEVNDDGDDGWRIEKRNKTTGAYDTNFNGSGYVNDNHTANIDRATAIAADSTYIYIFGTEGTDSHYDDWRIEKRFKSDGSYETSFGSPNGYITTDPGGSSDYAWSIDIDDTFIYLAGSQGVGCPVGAKCWRAEKRYQSNGNLETTNFGEGGYILVDPSNTLDDCTNIVVDDSYIYLTGYDGTGMDDWRIEKRGKFDGSSDAGFGSGGYVTVNPCDTETRDNVYGMIVEGLYIYLAGVQGCNGPLGDDAWRIEKRSVSDGSYAADVGATWKAAEDTVIIDQAREENVRLRLSVKNTSEIAADYNYQLQVAPKGTETYCEDVLSANYSNIPTTSSGCSGSVACMTTSAYFTNGDDTTRQLSIPDTEFSFVTGDIIEDPSNLTSAITLASGSFIEAEYNFQMTTNAEYSTAYCFRVTNNSTPLQTYSKVAELTVEDECLFSYYRQIVIDHTKVGLDNSGSLPGAGFPVLISLSGDWLKTTTVDPVNGRIANSSGYDIIFKDSGGTKLYHEIEEHDGTNGTLAAWVRVDSLSKSSDTNIYTHYGSSCTTSPTENPTAVWDSNFKMVQHLQETSGTQYDSTQYENNAIPYGGVNKNATGKIDGADDFAGDDDYLDSSMSSDTATNLTFSTWFKSDDAGAIGDDYVAQRFITQRQQTVAPAPMVESVTTSNQDGNSSSFLMSMPATRPDGDLYVAVVGKDGIGAITAPGGWNQIYELSDGSTVRHGVWWRIGSSEPVSYTWSNGSEEWSGAILRITGADATSPINISSTTTGNSINPISPSITPTINNTLILYTAAINTDQWVANYEPGGTSKVFSQNSGSGEASSANTAAASKTGGLSSTGTGAFTANGSDGWVAGTIAITPAGGTSRIALGINNNKVATYWHDGNENVQGGTTTLVVGTWYHAALTYDGSALRLYLNGSEENNFSESSMTLPSSDTIQIGHELLSRYFDGILDEVRVSDIVRSADWIRTAYNNQDSPGNYGSPGFYSVGDEETGEPSPPTGMEEMSSIDFSFKIYQGSCNNSGYLISTTIFPSFLANWMRFSWTDEEPENTDIKYQVLYWDTANWVPLPEDVLSGNAAGFDESIVDLCGVDPVSYPRLRLKTFFSTSDTSISPILSDWQVRWKKSSPSPELGNVSFKMIGSKIIGEDVNGDPVLKYSETHSTDSSGYLSILDLEWDVYSIVSPSVGAQFYNIAASLPLEPIDIEPDTSETLNLTLVPHAEHTLLIIVKNADGDLLTNALVRLYKTGYYDESIFTGESGQSFFDSLQAETHYSLEVSKPGYQNYLLNEVEVDGQSRITIIMTQ